MTSSVPAVLLAAGGVGLAHSVLPDHWVPLAVVARTRGDSVPRVARLSLLAGLAHVVVSLVLGAVVIAVGLSLRSTLESRADQLVGAVLILTGLAFIAVEVTGRGHHHDHADHEHEHEHDDHGVRDTRGLLGLLVPFGAAASPDLTILPVFLAAATLGAGPAAGALAVFSVVTVATFVGLTTMAALGGYQLSGQWLDRYANLITGGVLIVIGSLVAAHLL